MAQLHLPQVVIDQILAANGAGNVGESTAFRYDEAGNLKRVFRSDGTDIGYVRDADGRAWGEIDSDGRPTVACEALVAGGCADIAEAAAEDLVTSADRLISKTEYSGEGLVSRTVGPTGLETRYLRDSLGRVVSVQRRAGLEVLSTETLTYDPQSGLISSRDDGRAHAEALSYDGLKRLRTRLDDRGTSWQLGYDPLDRPTAARTGPTPFGAPDPALPTWERHTAYDGLGQAKRVVENGLTTILDNARSGQVLAIIAPGEGRRDVAYDRTGRPVVMLDAEGTLTVSLWDAAARTQTVSTVRRGLETEPLTTTMTETFDPLGRLVIRETVGEGGLEQLETWDHTGLAVTHTAPDGHQDVQVTNLAGLPVASQSTAAGGGWESTTYTYVLGGVGHEVQIQEPNGEWTTRTYDASGSMTAEERPSQGPNGAVWVYEYDGWGRERARHDPDGDSVFTCYDEDTGDLVATRTALPCDGAAAALLSTFWAYDDLGRATRASRRNAGGDVVTTERDLDPQGRVVRDALQVGGEPVLQVTSNWAAAATGWNRAVAYPTNAVWTRSNDRIGRLVALTGPQGNDIALNG